MTEKEKAELEISVGPEKASLKASGSAVERLTDSLADALSPFSSAAGVLGDFIRTYRQENAIRALSKAKRIAESLGVQIQPVPPKFLVRWTEGASLEDPGDEDLSELWANLLVDASRKYSPEHVHFCNLISQLSSSQADTFRDLIGTKSRRELEISYDEISMSLTQMCIRSEFAKAIGRMKEITPESIGDYLGRTMGQFGVEFVHAAADFSPNGDPEKYFDYSFDFMNYDSHDEMDYSILDAVGLIKDVQTDWFDVEGLSIVLTYYHITNLGTKFAGACGIVS